MTDVSAQMCNLSTLKYEVPMCHGPLGIMFYPCVSRVKGLTTLCDYHIWISDQQVNSQLQLVETEVTDI